MSDEGLVNLEDDAAPVETPAPPAAAAPAEPAVSEPPEHDAAEVEAVEVAGKKYVPVAAVISERKQRQALQDRAAKADQYERELNELRPYADFVKANPHLTQPRQPEPVPAVTTPSADPDAMEAAKLMDFWKTDGTPDVDRGAAWLRLQDRRSQRVTDQAVQPLTRVNQEQLAAQNYHTLLGLKHQDGTPVQKEVVDATWQQLMREPNGLTTAADRNSLSVLALMVMGADVLTRKQKVAPPPNAPVITEASGGNPATRPTLSALEQKIARERGLSQTAWTERTKGFTHGTANTLED